MNLENPSSSPRSSSTTQSEPPGGMPWYFHVLVGGGVWLGASLVALATALGFHDALSGPGAALIGVLLIIGAAAASRLSSRMVAEHLTFVGSFSGQALVLTALVGGGSDEALVIFALLQIITFIAIANRFHRVLSVLAFALVTLISPVFDWPVELPLLLLVVSIVCMVVGFGFERVVPTSFRRGLWIPLATGLALSTQFLLMVFEVIGHTATNRTSKMADYIVTDVWYFAISGLLVCGVLFLLVIATYRPQKPLQVSALVGAGVVLVVAVLTRGNLVLLGGLLTLGLAHHSHRRLLWAVGMVTLGLGLWWTYYSLSSSLLMKSLIVTGTGLGLLVAFALVVRLFPSTPKEPNAFAWQKRLRITKDGALLAGAVTLVIVTIGSLSAQKEILKRTGEVVLLELAPADPRSLMQGDFMRLNTQVARDIRRTPHYHRQDGNAVVTVDANSVAHFVRLESDATPRAPLARDERVFGYKVRGRFQVKVGPTEFFFEEGKQPHFQKAKFAEMRVSSSGTMLLVGLRDKDREPL